MNSPQSAAHQKISIAESVALYATLMCLVALSIDLILPAFEVIAQDLSIVHDNQRQLIIIAFFVGLAFGQIIYGPLSDSFGRKPVIIIGLVIFITGSLLAAFANSLEVILFARMVQGFGAAGPRVVTVALIRDRFEGESMARIMSLITGIFVFVPVFAPSIGKFLLLFVSWRNFFVILAMVAVIEVAWFLKRQPETKTELVPFSFSQLKQALLAFAGSPVSVGFTLAGAFAYGGLMGYVNSSQQIYQHLFLTGEQYAFWFSGSAVFIATGIFANAWLVRRFSAESICRHALLMQFIFMVIVSIFQLLTSWADQFIVFYIIVCINLGLLGLTFGNFTAIALKPLGQIAGTAASIATSLTTVISLAIAAVIGLSFNMTVKPVIVGFLICAAASLLSMYYSKPRRLT